MTLSDSDIVECRFCGGPLRPIRDRRAPYGFALFRCVECGMSNVLAPPQPQPAANRPN
jgi:hypothetical protein